MRMLTKILFSVVLAGLSAASPVWAQDPAGWERYALPGQKVSVLLPKMPVSDSGMNPCQSAAIDTFVLYHEDVVYMLKVTYKASNDFARRACMLTTEFQNSYETRVNELQTKSAATPFELRPGLRGMAFTVGNSKSWLAVEDKKARWFEFTVTARPGTPTSGEAFVNSLIIKDSSGQKIEKDVTNAVNLFPDSASTPPADQTDHPITILYKPRAAYTDTARKANAVGKVSLKVTLLSNGSIGTVTPIAELKYGLTEQAIEAAKRIVFLPKRVKGVNMSVVMTVEYSFSIY